MCITFYSNETYNLCLQFLVIGTHFALVHQIRTFQCSQSTMLTVYDTISNPGSIGIDEWHTTLRAPSNWVFSPFRLRISSIACLFYTISSGLPSFLGKKPCFWCFGQGVDVFLRHDCFWLQQEMIWFKEVIEILLNINRYQVLFYLITILLKNSKFTEWHQPNIFLNLHNGINLKYL